MNRSLEKIGKLTSLVLRELDLFSAKVFAIISCRTGGFQHSALFSKARRFDLPSFDGPSYKERGPWQPSFVIHFSAFVVAVVNSSLALFDVVQNTARDVGKFSP